MFAVSVLAPSSTIRPGVKVPEVPAVIVELNALSSPPWSGGRFSVSPAWMIASPAPRFTFALFVNKNSGVLPPVTVRVPIGTPVSRWTVAPLTSSSVLGMVKFGNESISPPAVRAPPTTVKAGPEVTRVAPPLPTRTVSEPRWRMPFSSSSGPPATSDPSPVTSMKGEPADGMSVAPLKRTRPPEVTMLPPLTLRKLAPLCEPHARLPPLKSRSGSLEPPVSEPPTFRK